MKSFRNNKRASPRNRVQHAVHKGRRERPAAAFNRNDPVDAGPGFIEVAGVDEADRLPVLGVDGLPAPGALFLIPALVVVGQYVVGQLKLR